MVDSGHGELLDAAERDGFEVFVTDQKLKHQRNLSARGIAIIVLTSTSWPRVQRAIGAVTQAVDSASPGSYAEVPIA